GAVDGAVGGHQHHVQVGVVGVQLRQQLDAVVLAEAQVEQQELRPLLRQRGQQLRLVGGAADAAVPGAEVVLHQAQNVGVVVGAQDQRLGEPSHLSLGAFRRGG